MTSNERLEEIRKTYTFDCTPAERAFIDILVNKCIGIVRSESHSGDFYHYNNILVAKGYAECAYEATMGSAKPREFVLALYTFLAVLQSNYLEKYCISVQEIAKVTTQTGQLSSLKVPITLPEFITQDMNRLVLNSTELALFRLLRGIWQNFISRPTKELLHDMIGVSSSIVAVAFSADAGDLLVHWLMVLKQAEQLFSKQ